MFVDFLRWLWERIAGKPGLWGYFGRSGQWPRVRREFLERNPVCAGCGGVDERECHHVEPYWKRPDLELDPNNLIVLCAKNGCHWRLGHNCHSWSDYNEHVRTDAILERERLETRRHP